MAICVSFSFALAAPFSMRSENLYKRYKRFWNSFQKPVHHPRDQLIQTGEARVLVIGMGRVGCGAYDNLCSYFDQKIIGIEHDTQRVKQQGNAGRKLSSRVRLTSLQPWVFHRSIFTPKQVLV